MVQSVVLALDIGSSSLRCLAYPILDDNNQELSNTIAASHSIPFRAVQPNTGRICVFGDKNDTDNNSNAEKTLLDMIDECIDRILEKLNEKYQQQQEEGKEGEDEEEQQDGYIVSAVGFSTFVMNLVGVDEIGNLLGPQATLSYACNTKAVNEEVKILKSELGEENASLIYQNTGAPIHAAYALAQLRIFYKQQQQEEQSTTIPNVSKWLTIASACVSRWTNSSHHEMPISYSEASWTGLLNYHTCQYEPSVLALLPEECRNHLPILADYNDVKFQLNESSSYYNRWPALQSARFCLGLGDGACANIGSKCTSIRRVACTVGTSAAARICLPLSIQNITNDNNTTTDDAILSNVATNITVEPGLFCYRIDKTHVLVGGALTDGGNVVEWASQLLRISSTEELQACMEEVEVLAEKDYIAAKEKPHPDDDDDDVTNESSQGSPLLTMVPFLSGERSTGFRSSATGAILGLTRDTTPAHLLKACLEGVTLRIAAIVHLIDQTVLELQQTTSSDIQIICSGKALEVNGLWRQMLSDCCGFEVVLDEETKEGSSRGAAIMILSAIGEKEPDGETPSIFGDEEPISLSDSVFSQPRRRTRKYWKKLSLSQENLIDAVSPLYV